MHCVRVRQGRRINLDELRAEVDENDDNSLLKILETDPKIARRLEKGKYKTKSDDTHVFFREKFCQGLVARVIKFLIGKFEKFTDIKLSVIRYFLFTQDEVAKLNVAQPASHGINMFCVFMEMLTGIFRSLDPTDDVFHAMRGTHPNDSNAKPKIVSNVDLDDHRKLMENVFMGANTAKGLIGSDGGQRSAEHDISVKAALHDQDSFRELLNDVHSGISAIPEKFRHTMDELTRRIPLAIKSFFFEKHIFDHLRQLDALMFFRHFGSKHAGGLLNHFDVLNLQAKLRKMVHQKLAQIIANPLAIPGCGTALLQLFALPASKAATPKGKSSNSSESKGKGKGKGKGKMPVDKRTKTTSSAGSFFNAIGLYHKFLYQVFTEFINNPEARSKGFFPFDFLWHTLGKRFTEDMRRSATAAVMIVAPPMTLKGDGRSSHVVPKGRVATQQNTVGNVQQMLDILADPDQQEEGNDPPKAGRRTTNVASGGVAAEAAAVVGQPPPTGTTGHADVAVSMAELARLAIDAHKTAPGQIKPEDTLALVGAVQAVAKPVFTGVASALDKVDAITGAGSNSATVPRSRMVKFLLMFMSFLRPLMKGILQLVQEIDYVEVAKLVLPLVLAAA